MKKNEYSVAFLFLATLASVMAIAARASAKSLYVNRDLNAGSPIRAYDIQAGGTLVFQMDSSPTRYGGVGLAIDTDAEILFVTFEGSGTLDIVDAKTLTIRGRVTAPGATNLAGIVVDQNKSKLYTVNRGSTSLYVYDWDSSGPLLTLECTVALSGAYQAYGLALDEANNLLYLGDLSHQIKVYSTEDWSLVDQIPVSQLPMAVAVDVANGYVYSGNAYPPYGCTGELVQYDLVSSTETSVDIRTLPGAVYTDCVVGVAVDPLTGLVFVTTGNQGVGGSDRVLTFDSTLALLSATGDIGNPTGIVVPGRDISYNPLNLTKVDGLGEDECVYAGDGIQYTICYDNTDNDYSITGVTLTDTLPSEVDFVSASGGAAYDPDAHTVTWDVGILGAGDLGGCETIGVLVTSGTPPESELANSAEIAGTFPGDKVIPTTQNETTTVCPNTPPVAVCQDVYVLADVDCNGTASAADVDAGSYDPDGDTLSLSVDPAGPYPIGTTEVTLTVSDGMVEDSCTAAVTVIGPTNVAYDGDVLLCTEGAPTADAAIGATLLDEMGDPLCIDDQEVTFTLVAEGVGVIEVGPVFTVCGVAEAGVTLEPGIYSILVQTACSDATGTALLAVYNPEGGFATGGGWIIPQADEVNTQPGQRANFGFNVRYKKDVPSGQVEFRYTNASIDLKSSTLDQLVIAGTTIAQFKGTASVNGEDGWSFLTKVVDNGEPGSSDIFDMKIWSPEDDVEGDPTDRARSVLDGGNIVIHNK